MTAEEMLAKKVWAVVGASKNPHKYGNMIYHKLKKNNYRVYAVNPIINAIGEDTVYPTLAALPEKPDVINMVVAPELAKQYLREAAGLGIQSVWFQPGTHDDSVMALAAELGLHSIQGCVLVASRRPIE